MNRKLLSLVIAMAICSVAFAEDGAWSSDFAKAQAAAVEKKLPIMALFTGSDWCPWCIKLNDQVLSTVEFKAYAKDNLILFIADFPRQKKLAGNVEKQNQALADKYNIEGFPTVVLMNAEGKELARTGYLEGGCKAYVEHIKGLLQKKR